MGRHSDNKLRSKKPIPGRPSMDRISRNNQEILPKRSANAWLPRRAEKNIEKTDEDLRIEVLIYFKKLIKNILEC